MSQSMSWLSDVCFSIILVNVSYFLYIFILRMRMTKNVLNGLLLQKYITRRLSHILEACQTSNNMLIKV